MTAPLSSRLRIFFAYSLLMTAGCSNLGQPVTMEFVLPAGFKGPFIIVTGSNGQSCQLRGNKVTFHVPESGILIVEKDLLFIDEYRLVARFADGTPLSTSTFAAPTQCALRGGGHSSGYSNGLDIPPHEEWFVGTETEFADCDYRQLIAQIPK
jgi:hypothetical protein